MEVEINALNEPVEPVPMDELSIARYVEPVSESDFIERIIAGDLNAMLHNLDLCIQEQENSDAE